MPELIGLDFETYGAEDLPTHGLDRYASDPTFRPLIGSVAFRGQSTAVIKKTLSFFDRRQSSVEGLRAYIGNRMICAHNAPFEQRVLHQLGLDYPSSRFIDSAVVARAAGAGSRLEAAAPQLLHVNKLEEGKSLIKLFSIPGKYQEDNGSPEFDPRVIEEHPDEWLLFGKYCELDAELSLRLVEDFGHYLSQTELEFQAITMDMNRAGWCVDVPLVEEMQRRYLENQEQALAQFRASCNAGDLNLNSLKQLKEWTAERGVKCVSFDEKHVERYLRAVNKKLDQLVLGDPKFDGYNEVAMLLQTKQILGGSSLKKLRVILNTATPDPENPGRHRLRDQYLHIGAAQSWRTTGRSVQMQNLKRLGGEVDDMSELDDEASVWDNGKLAQNLRQVFTATDPSGRLIVGDFKSVESRGLAYLAGEEWKLDAYRQGKDMYKVLATQMFSVHYDDVLKPQRTTGKVGELSCGYGAGGPAVQSFADGMGVTFSEAEAAKLVSDWRESCPATVTLWNRLDEMLHRVVEQGTQIERHYLPHDHLVLKLIATATPDSLLKQHPDAQTVTMTITNSAGDTMMRRVFHGCYSRGRNICYYKPSDRKTGDLWRSHYTDPKTKQVRFYELYGGKLAGILTQSFCRELFFRSLRNVCAWTQHPAHLGQVLVVGQFHDEIVTDWRPGPLGLDDAKQQIELMMSDPGALVSFPLAAEIKDDYRYTK